MKLQHVGCLAYDTDDLNGANEGSECQILALSFTCISSWEHKSDTTDCTFYSLPIVHFIKWALVGGRDLSTNE